MVAAGVGAGRRGHRCGDSARRVLRRVLQQGLRDRVRGPGDRVRVRVGRYRIDRRPVRSRHLPDGGAAGTSLIDTADWGQVPADQVAVVLADDKTRADAERIAQTLGGSISGELEFINLYQIQTAGKTEADLRTSLETASGLPGVSPAFPNQQVSFADGSGVCARRLDDPAYAGDFGKGYNLVGAQKAWTTSGEPGSTCLRSKRASSTPTYIPPVVNSTDRARSSRSTPPDPRWAGSGSTTAAASGSSGQPRHHGGRPVGSRSTNGGQTGVASPALGNKLTMVSIDMYGAGYGTIEVAPNPADYSQYVTSDGKAWSLGGIVAMTKALQAGCRVINCSWGCRPWVTTMRGSPPSTASTSQRRLSCSRRHLCVRGR